MKQENSLGKEAGIENPVVERLGYWLDKVGPEKFGAFLEWKQYKFIPPSIIVANLHKSILKKIWTDYVDGVFCWFYLSTDPEIKFSFFNIPELMEKGIQEIVNFAIRPEVQKVVINTHQFSTDQIWITEKIQVKLNAKSLFKFNQRAKELLITEDSIIELRKKFIEKMKKNYGLEGLSKTSTRKEKPSSLTTPETGIVLHYLMEYGSNDFKYTSDKVILADYLVKLKLNPSPSENLEPNYSPSQVYNKGIVLLPSEKQKRRGKKGVFTKTNFWNAIQFLEEIDNEAYTAAFTDFIGYSSDETNPSKEEEGISEIFFKK